MHVDTDYPMFRLPDVYLMYAECVLRNGGGDKGPGSELHQRDPRTRYGNTDGNIVADDLTLDFVLDERSRELYWEAMRRTDLVRFGQFTSGIWPWKGGVKEGVASEAYRVLFPIPASDIIANPNLTQNDGYDFSPPPSAGDLFLALGRPQAAPRLIFFHSHRVRRKNPCLIRKPPIRRQRKPLRPFPQTKYLYRFAAVFMQMVNRV